jgi:hypothetical protein
MSDTYQISLKTKKLLTMFVFSILILHFITQTTTTTTTTTLYEKHNIHNIHMNIHVKHTSQQNMQ